MTGTQNAAHDTPITCNAVRTVTDAINDACAARDFDTARDLAQLLVDSGVFYGLEHGDDVIVEQLQRDFVACVERRLDEMTAVRKRHTAMVANLRGLGSCSLENAA